MTSEKTANHSVALIDIGNTRMKIGWLNLLSGQREDAALALEHKDVEQMAHWFVQQKVRPDRAIGVNVAGKQKSQAVEAYFADSFGIAIQWLGSQLQAGHVLNRYTEPAQLGADRWIAMIGLGGLQPDSQIPMLLASFGTATTLDTLCPIHLVDTASRNPNHRQENHEGLRWVYDGGLIFPGPGLMRASLASNTAQLPEANGTPTAFPTNTHQAITTGIAAAQAGAVVRQWQAIVQRYDVVPAVYGTGGGWPTVQDEAQALLATVQQLHKVPLQPIQYLASPILDGLARMAERL